MSNREKARIVSSIGKSRKELRGLDDRVRKYEELLRRAENNLLRIQQVRDKVSDKLDMSLEAYDKLEDRSNG